MAIIGQNLHLGLGILRLIIAPFGHHQVAVISELRLHSHYSCKGQAWARSTNLWFCTGLYGSCTEAGHGEGCEDCTCAYLADGWMDTSRIQKNVGQRKRRRHEERETRLAIMVFNLFKSLTNTTALLVGPPRVHARTTARRLPDR